MVDVTAQQTRDLFHEENAEVTYIDFVSNETFTAQGNRERAGSLRQIYKYLCHTDPVR